jgi:hypothetical protein
VNVSIRVTESESKGMHTVTFDAAGLPAGVYFCELSANGVVRRNKMLLVK